jgi:hypothetical protein
VDYLQVFHVSLSILAGSSMEEVNSTRPSHKEWRRIARRERRRRLRRKAAQERDAQEESLRAALERDPDYLNWRTEQDRLEVEKEAQEEKERAEGERFWLEEEVGKCFTIVYPSADFRFFESRFNSLFFLFLLGSSPMFDIEWFTYRSSIPSEGLAREALMRNTFHFYPRSFIRARSFIRLFPLAKTSMLAHRGNRLSIFCNCSLIHTTGKVLYVDVNKFFYCMQI